MTKLEYMLAGRAVFTVVSGATGKRYTFRVQQLDPTKIRGDAQTIHFAQYLYGRDNESSYRSFATIFNGRRVWPSTGFTREHPVFQAFLWVTTAVLADQGGLRDNLPNCEFIPSGRCCRCARLLTTPESVSAGIGPECREKIASA